ncbi:MAG TPA: VCBS repeat-containing protein, partial [Aggregicoccus sp.]|nr:VCBS repeat-containing protein [Aggregicoccus sp.]
VLLGRADGGLRTAVLYPTAQPAHVAFADLDGDGDQDLVLGTSTYLEQRLLVRLNAGDGTLQAALPVAVTTDVQALAVADFDADGHPDVVTAGTEYTQQYVHRYTLLLGRGDGTFQEGPVPSASGWAYALVAGDFDRNGTVDLVASVSVESAARLELLPGTGGGRFGPAVRAPDRPESRYGMETRDLDGDGDLDLLLPSNCELLGDGTGHFSGTPCERDYELWAVRVGDLDGDGTLDRLGTESWLPGRPGGGALTGELLQPPAASGTVAAGDLDRDGTLDLLVTPGLYLRGHGDGRFTPHVTAAATYYDSGRMHLRDVDADGVLDSISLRPGYSESLRVARGRGDGSFEPAAAYNQLGGPRSFIAEDLNADGHLDLVTSGAGPLTVVRLGQGDAAFGPANASAATGHTRFVFASDVDADGHLDLVSALEASAQPLQRQRGRGDGTFEPATAHPAGGTVHLMPIAAGDFDGDGLVDVAAHRTWTTTWQLSLLRGLPGGGFQELLSPEAPRVVGEVVEGYAADVDGDGHLDLVATEGYGTVSLFRGRGDGTWHEGLHARTPEWHRLPVLFADADRSGLPELYYESGATLYRLPLR